MAKPSDLPIWDENQTNIVTTPQDNQDEGWLNPAGIPEKPPFEVLNYWQNNVYRWLEHYDSYVEVATGGDVDITTGDLTVTTGDLTVTSGNLSIKSQLYIVAPSTTDEWLLYTHTDDSFRINFNGAGGDDIILTSSGNLRFGAYTAGVLQTDASGNVTATDTLHDISTDQYLDSDTNTFWGVDVAGAGNLTHGSSQQGWYNTAIGNEAGYNLTTGYWNVIIGDSAGRSMTTANGNVICGHEAGDAIITGFANTLVGPHAGGKLTGSTNTGFGASALGAVTTGNGNVGVGAALAGPTNVTGDYNLGIGDGAGQSLTSGSRNCLLGPVSSGYYITEGDDNICIGYKSGRGTTTSDYSVHIGYEAGVLTGNYSSCVTLGYQADALAGNNEVQIGGTQTCYSSSSWTTRSDRRDKTEIQKTDLGLDFILKLNAVKHKWDQRDEYRRAERDELGEKYEPKMLSEYEHDGTFKRKRFHQAFIAQEVKEVMTDLDVDFAGYLDSSVTGDDDILSLQYSQFIPPLVQAVQDQQEIIDDQKKQIDKQQDQINRLEEMVNKLIQE